MSAQENCTFCKIIARRMPGHIIDEDDSVIVFLSLEHHPMIVPKRHVQDLLALDRETASLIIQKSIAVAKAMRLGLPCDGIYVTQTNGKCAGQSVFHYHMHLYPKWDVQEPRHRKQLKEDIAGRIRIALTQR
jgi:histidine triad (HIT) family protein